MKRKHLILTGSLVLCVGLWALFFTCTHTEKKGAVEFKEISLAELPALSCQKVSGIIKAIDISVSILEKGKKDHVSILNKKIDTKALVNGLLSLKERLKEGQGLMTAIKDLFFIYELVENGKRNRLLVTGYYQPELQGSINRDDMFTVPVLSRPLDLIGARLKDFGKDLPGVTLWGRVEGQRFLPYYERKEIQHRFKELPELYPVLCWLRSQVDLLELQIQGSGIVKLGSERRFIHYAASNGLPYTSLGKLLLKKGILSPGDLDWPSIRRWAETHPEKFDKLLARNKRYVFFKWERQGPVGCFGHVLVPGVSAAFDRRIFPAGIPLWVSFVFPETRYKPEWMACSPSKRCVGLFVVNHDTGSAITGPFRMDLYIGTGQIAGMLAGKLKHRARMFVLIPKNSIPDNLGE